MTRQTKAFSNMAAKEQVCCWALPAVDQDLVPLFRSPGSLFGGPACLNKDSKAMESLLGKLHRSEARLANTAAILTLYTHHLSGLMQNQPVDASLAREFQSATMCLASVSKEEAVASGRTLAQLWVVRRHLRLSQSKLQPADRDCLLRVPVEPTAMFGPQASSLLQQARDRRRWAEEVSESLGSRGKPVSTEPRPCHGDGFPKAPQSPRLVEGPSQHQEGADHGDSDSPPDRIYMRIHSRLGNCTQRPCSKPFCTEYKEQAGGKLFHPLTSRAEAGCLAPDRDRLLALGLTEAVVQTMQEVL
ncbi:unnamed protein product [Arctogadus glacialis]